MMNSQKSDAEEINLTEAGKKMKFNEVIKCNKIIDNTLKT